MRDFYQSKELNELSKKQGFCASICFKKKKVKEITGEIKPKALLAGGNINDISTILNENQDDLRSELSMGSGAFFPSPPYNEQVEIFEGEHNLGSNTNVQNGAYGPDDF